MTLPRPEPCFFGPQERPLFGWLHRPAADRRAGVGLIICNPFGYEAICAHRSLRHFATAAADAGIAALRFDYDGTGDSAGDDLDEGRVEAWLNSIDHAADTLQAMTGVSQICLLGVRLGATLATLAAARRADVAALIAIAPVVSAKAYVRELRALNMAMRRGDSAEETDNSGVLETAGFLLTAATQGALKAIDLNRTLDRPCPEILILDREDMPANEPWAQTLRSTGAAVERQSVPGYVEMMLDSHETVVPERMIETAIGWLARINANQVAPPSTSRAAAVSMAKASASSVPAADVEETVFFFGDGAPRDNAPYNLTPLFGILSRPVPGRRSSAIRPKGILLLNAGAVQHIGPNRMYVTLARHWAALGHTVFRLDLSGIGDSPVRPGATENVVYSQHANAEIRTAVDFLQREFQVGPTYTLGLCSGAYHGFKAAVAHAPLAGVILINPLTFFWKEGMSLEYAPHRISEDIGRYKTNAFRADSWRKLLSGNVDLWQLAQVLARRLGASLVKPLRDMARGLGLPLAEDLGTELQNLAKSSTDMLFVFAAEDPGLDLLTTQGGAAVSRLKAQKKLATHIIAGADHTFTQRAARNRLVEILAQKLDLPNSRDG